MSSRPAPSAPRLTRAQVRRVDQLAVDELAIPGIVLMENAARSFVDILVEGALRWWGRPIEQARIVIIAGGGNNGGDGYAIARHLHNRMSRMEPAEQRGAVRLAALKPIDDLSGDAHTNAVICRRMQMPIDLIADEAGLAAHVEAWADVDLVIDAMLGTGFAADQPLKPLYEQMVDAIAHWRSQAVGSAERGDDHQRKVAAVDVPTGLDCDSASIAPRQDEEAHDHANGCAIRADLTVTFAAMKGGFDLPAARTYIGEVHVGDIGVSAELVDRARQQG